MQFQVPQFIDTEDKIIAGILTLRQFLIIVAGGGVSFLFFFMFNSVTWLLLTILVAAVVVAIAFVKFNGRPLPTMLISIFSYYWNPRFYTWKTEPPETDAGLPAIKTKIETHAFKTFQFKKKERPETSLSRPNWPPSEVSAPVRKSPLVPGINLHNLGKDILSGIKSRILSPYKNRPVSRAPEFRDQKKPEVPGVKTESQKEIKISQPTVAAPEYKTSAHVPETPRPETENPVIATPAAKVPEIPRSQEVVPTSDRQKTAAAKPQEKPIEKTTGVPEPEPFFKPQKAPALEPSHYAMSQPVDHHKEMATAVVRETFQPKTTAPQNQALKPAAPTYESQPRPEENRFLSLRAKISGMTGVQDLFEKINTSKISLPKREKFLSFFHHQNHQNDKEVIRDATGIISEAKRVDY